MAEVSLAAKLAAEFIGTFMLVFTVGCNVLSGQPVWAGVSIACVLTVMIYALGKSSGANFNPAVSLALGITKKMAWSEVGMYMATQLVAGVLACVCYKVLFLGTTVVFKLEPTRGHTLWQAGVAELLYTFMLCFVVLNVACSKVHADKNEFYGLAIGFVIVAGAYSGGSVSMGCFNPAVAIGITGAHLWMAPFYWLFEFAGAGMAAGLFLFCRPDELDRNYPTDATGMPKYEITQKLVSEFLGTFMLVLTVGLNVLSGSPAGAFSIAAALMSMIFALGTVSGAHFNPAVTVAIVLAGRDKCTPKDAAAYIGTQILAGIVAALTYTAMMNGQTFALKPQAYAWTQSILAEVMFTFVLCFVVLSVATVKTVLSEYFGFAIGMCVTVGGFAIGKVSGGSLNPAVSFGISTSHIIGGGVFIPCLIYTVFELIAGAVAAGAFVLTQPSEYETAEQAAEKKPLNP